MTVEEIIELLNQNEEVLESYVLIRELKVFLKVGSAYHPEVGIKIYYSGVMPHQPYHFEVSHLVHTPLQASPYATSHNTATTEEGAINQAIASTTRFIKHAISEGKAYDDSWLVPNKRF